MAKEKNGMGIYLSGRKFSATRASSTRTQKKELEIEDMKIEILTRNESVKYLGQKSRSTTRKRRKSNIKNRIRAAWATFRKYRQELTSKNYMLNHRLRLFDAAIPPTILLRSRNMDTQQRT